MSHENGDDPDDELKTYREYQIAKNPRAAKPEDAGPADPAEDFKGVGGDDWQADVAKDLGAEFPDDVAKDHGDRPKTFQDVLDAIADDMGAGMVSKDAPDDETDLSADEFVVDWEQAMKDQQKSEREILLEVRDELRRLDAPTPTAAKAVEKALADAEGDDAEGGQDTEDPFEKAIEQLDELSAMLEERMDGEASA